MGNGPVLVQSLSVEVSYESMKKYRKLVVTHKSISLMASYECCKIEGSCLRPLVDRLFHRLRLVVLDYCNRKASSTSWKCVKVNLSDRRQSAPSETFGQPTSQNQGYSTGRGRSYAILKTSLLYCVNCQVFPNKSLC